MKRIINQIKESSRIWNLAGWIIGNGVFKNKLKRREERVSRVIFVCTGNICRSPFAEYRAKQLLTDIEICSAGVHAETGDPADSMAVRMSTKFGVDLVPHKTTRFSEYEISPTDLILIMDKFHQSFIEKYRPDLTTQTVLLGSFCRSKEFPLIVGDPWSQGEVSFNFCYRQIEDALVGLKMYLDEPTVEK